MENPNIIDLFCGVGGITLGALRAGFNVVASIDNDPRIKNTFIANFPSCTYLEAEISKILGKELLRQVNINGEVIHGIVGGPPCQGFSRIGLRKLDDERNFLFEHFFRLVAEIRPWFYVVENVIGILDARFNQMRREALSNVVQYCNLDPIILNASDFGAATNRERVFFIGYLSDHFDGIYETDFAAPTKIEAINVETALRGLVSRISPDWQTEELGWRKLSCKPKGVFWQKVFDEIPEDVGDSYAVQQLKKYDRVSGCLGTKHTGAVIKRFSELAEGAVDAPSRAVRLQRNGFCPTLRSGTGPDHGSYQALRPIHPTEPRAITPREAARLQGFPDWFLFDSTKWHSFRQLGNSVSPILAEAILLKIAEKLNL